MAGRAEYTVVGALATRTLRVLWMLEELGEAYNYDPAPPQSDRVRRLEPSGKVPLLLVGDTVLSESVAILTYLADRHGRLTHPPGTLERARQDSLVQFCVDSVEGALWTAAKHSFVLPEALRVPEVKAACRHDFAQAMATLERHLGDGPYLMGEHFTVPDILFGHAAGWAEKARFELPSGAVGAYLDRIRARPAFAAALARGQAATAAAG